ncbi:hypothetical protein PHYBLDRAFT_159940 [Phycomyces blakesleeanus NRRL 1555(-)]|uniref:Uncharacterized protein n=1 Tax=Phycomyces blakesleeanus (strain ATCC 8743b / DSM 1359 / FGSC 10004 / NBRC 33097 / NRRL 1555) TaxID=763407 RepID=A0A167L1Q4_PHYB8|nr:hypothetical protein PHYBLDRAFT_159940 [Phycomyces blakesleeanus NRRL 1555(-)]OAD69389.1 hypothetical protein PHYBLDRAFT_159940 [Phycomyces blakesleeanus NRRL 1555(-)]|eukprot:XP_018287429.1 hypothetical protein PHYBLDRAFT_159940 [Phycomyces blakesleeanus NRRL 1555(-)]
MTGQNFAHSPYYQQPMNAVSVPLSSVLPQPLIPSPTAAGQHMQRTGYGSGLQRSQTMGSGIASQPTGVRNWQTATPENPFGSPSMSPLSPQMTGVQFSTPNPNAFNYNPVQSPQANYLQPQLTGFPVQQQPQQTGLFPNASPAHVFTPNGSMQHGQSGFSQQPMYTGMNQQQGQFGRGW